MDNLKEYYYSFFNPNPEPYILNREGYVDFIPFFTDLHLTLKDPLNRKNYFEKQIAILCNLDEFLEANNINTVIDGGDLYDRGFKSLDTVRYNHLNYFLRKLFGTRRSYFLKGNHEDTYSLNNPSYELVSITSESLKKDLLKRDIMMPTAPILNAVESISIGNIDIHFVHFSKSKNYYIPPSKESNRQVIALFHDDIITIESQNALFHHNIEGVGIDANVSNIMDCIDIALLAHIHKPLRTVTLNNWRQTKIYTPGALCQNSRAEDYTQVKIPIIAIKPDGYADIIEVPFNLGEIRETLNEKDEKMTKQRKFVKAVKSRKEKVKGLYTLNDYLETLTPEERQIINLAENPITPSTVDRYWSRTF